MRIQQLKYIIKIVETGSMNEASKRLFVTQPSLSNAVRELEEEMNIKIFTRSTRGITLTSDGAEFLSYGGHERGAEQGPAEPPQVEWPARGHVVAARRREDHELGNAGLGQLDHGLHGR